MAKIEVEGRRRSESRIPVSSPAPLRRTGSLRLGACPPIKEHQSDKKYTLPKLNRRHSLQSLNTAKSYSYDRDDDADSVGSFDSSASVCSNLSQCDHAHFARNGTTYSGRCKRYVVHCSPHSTETDDYLTPTQRTNRTIRRLRSLLKDAQADLLEKEKEILRLTKEVVELRLLKVDSTTDSNDLGTSTVEQAQGDSVDSRPPSCQNTNSPRPRSCSTPPVTPSLSDSGHFEDLNPSKETLNTIQSQINQIKTIESLQRQHEDEIRELKEKHNDKVDSLLQRITDVNDRYYALRPLYEDCKEKISELQKLNEELKKNLCFNHNEKISELEILNSELLQDKHVLVNEINALKSKIEEMEVDKFNCDELMVENNELKNKQNELIAIINTQQETKCKSGCTINCAVLDGNIQNEYEKVQNLSNHNEPLQETQSLVNNSCQSNEYTENCELKAQIEAHIENPVENQEKKDTNTQILKKEVEGDPVEARDSTVIPDLLLKLRIKQEELDNVKAMYRRLLATRKDEPKHDPEMTLQFLKSAFYYFLTDRENAPGHLSAIESILGFTDTEKLNIEKAFLWR